MTKNWTAKSISDYEEIAKDILSTAFDKRVFFVEGNMGAGKTTLIKSLAQALGVKQLVNSPTFSLVNEYSDKDKNPVYHFDLFRVKNKRDLREVGIEEYVYSGFYCFIEWPQLAEEFVDEKAVITIKNAGDDSRNIQLLME
jgi:tRNA threonylcarbamoyladenosine biosynthesis protein TsaE